MSKLLQTIQSRRVRRQQLSLQRWEQVRAKGKARFVLQQALTWTVFMNGIRDVSVQIIEGGSQVTNVRFHLISYSLTGIFIGFFAWWKQEGKYKNALINHRLQPPFDNQITPR